MSHASLPLYRLVDRNIDIIFHPFFKEGPPDFMSMGEVRCAYLVINNIFLFFAGFMTSCTCLTWSISLIYDTTVMSKEH